MTDDRRREAEAVPEAAPAAAMALALCFAAGPLLIAVELLRPVYWLPLLAAAVAWAWSVDGFLHPRGTRRSPVAPGRRMAVAAGTLAWILPSGIGSLGACHWDYIKHNLVFSRLLAQHLPLALGDGAPFHYYFAYYILPVRLYQGLAIVLPGLPFDAVLLGLYAVLLVLGVELLAWGFRAPAGRLLLLLVLTGGGLDLIGLPLLGGHLWRVGQVPGLGLPLLEGFEWWGVPMAPQSFTMHLYWAPQHLFAALIGTALLAAFGRLARPLPPTLLHAGVVIAAAAFWSVYVAIGLAVLVAGEILRRLAGTGVAARSSPRLVPAVAAAPFCVLLAAFGAAYVTAARAASPPGLVFDTGSPLAWAATLQLNHAPWLAALALVPAAAAPAAERRALAAMLGFGLLASALLLCLRHGTYNDWAMRTVLPAGLLLTAATARLLALPLPRRGWWLLVLLLALSGASSLSQIAQGLFAPWRCAPYGAYGEGDLGPLLPQYEGDPDSLLYRTLARRRP